MEDAQRTTREPLSEGRTRNLWFALALFLGALAPRSFVALTWTREPVWDGHYYHFGASRIAAGLGYSEDVMIDGVSVWKPWCHYPVGYSGLLGWVYKLFGNGLFVGPLMNALLGALTAVCVYWLAQHFVTERRARVAGALCALHPGLIAYTALLMTEPLAALTLVLGGLLALWRASSYLGPIASGVVLGLGTLVRPPALLALPWLLPVYFRGWAPKQLARAVSLVALTGAAALLVVSPWTLRNCRVMDGCALVSTNGGWNLAIGALTETGRFTALEAKWGCPGPGQVNQDRCWGRLARAKIAEDPMHWLSLIPSKLKHTYNHESFAVAYLGEADPEGWPEARKEWWRTLTTVFHHLLMAAAALSCISLWPPSAARTRLVTWSRRVLRKSRPGLDAALPAPPPMPPRGGDEWLGFAVQLALALAFAGWVTYTLGLDEPALYWLIVVAPLVALVRLPGAPAMNPAAIYAWGLVAITSLTHSIFFGDDRYHLTISPVLCMLAAGLLRAPQEPTLEPAASSTRTTTDS